MACKITHSKCLAVEWDGEIERGDGVGTERSAEIQRGGRGKTGGRGLRRENSGNLPVRDVSPLLALFRRILLEELDPDRCGEDRGSLSAVEALRRKGEEGVG